MNNWIQGWLVLVTATSSTGVTLPQCTGPAPQAIELTEDVSGQTIRCDGTGQSGTVDWLLLTSTSDINLVSCPAPNDCRAAGTTFTATRDSTSSTLRMDTSATRQFGNLVPKCRVPSDDVTCQLDVVYRASVTSCSAQFNTAGTQWTVSGTCDVSKAYSVRGRYSCTWTEHRAGNSTPIPASQTNLTKTPYTEDGATYNSVTCSFNRPFPTVTGTYTYRVIISPGSVTPAVSGSNTIERPVTPSITCSPSPYVPENQNVTCTCNTQSVGSPEGRLKWFRGNNLINTGNYGDTTLVMTPQTLTRSDHGNTVFRCDVDWSQAIIRDQYTASVGYLDSPTLIVSPVEVTENQTVTFTCRADDARPTPYVTLANRDNGIELSNQSSSLSHSLSRARCEDAGVYTCTASNGMGPDMMDDVTLRVKCKPRAVQPEIHPSVNFNEKLTSLTFNITAYPTPKSFNFTFLGPNMTTVTASPVGIALNASCQKDARSLYSVICTVTVDNVTTAAAGFYRVTLINDQGHGDVIFQVKVNV